MQRMNENEYKTAKQQILNDPSVSFRLKRIINEFDSADVVDILHEIEALDGLFTTRFNAIVDDQLKECNTPNNQMELTNNNAK